jgi:hypothetical protein
VLAAAVASAAVFSCRPAPGLGSITVQRHGRLHVIDLATCRQRIKRGLFYRGFSYGAPLRSPDGRLTASVRSSGHGKSAKETIWVTTRDGRSHPVFSETQYYKTIGPGETPGPILLRGWSRDDRWIFFFVVPGASGSIAADGLTLRVVSATGGAATKIARMLPYPDYLTWCGGRLVFAAGMDRVATDHKRLLVATPPSWRPHRLVTAPSRSWGSLDCAPNGRWLVAQSQRQSSVPNFFATHWALWRVGLDGSRQRLTSPPQGSADESPRFSRTGDALLFVRMRKGNGHLFALRGSRVVGPLLFLGNNIGYYGHHDWWLTAAWSRGR